MVHYSPWNGRKQYGTDTPWQRHDHARGPSGNTAIASFGRGTESNLWDQSQNGAQMAQAGYGRGLQDGPEGTAFERSQP